MTAPLMPKATAVWLIENTNLTFRQISNFCEIHELEIQAMADGDVGSNIRGISPIDNGQLTWAEIHRCENDIAANLQAEELECNAKLRNMKAKKLLSPSQRQDKPNAILWVVKNYPNIKDSLICKLIGTTKATIEAIRNGTHKEMANLRAKDPVSIGLCSEYDIDNAVAASQPKVKAEKVKKVKKTAKKTAKTTKKKVAKKNTAAKKKVAKKTSVKKAAPAKKTTTKKTATKKVTAKKVVAKKATKATAAKKTTTAKKATTKKTTAKKTVAKKTAAKKAPAKKATVKKTVAKKATVKKSVTKKTATKKTSVKKTVAKKTTAKKTVAKKTAATKKAAKK